jgi:colanic acid/amylovoran biosynthesis glycosyltransferase
VGTQRPTVAQIHDTYLNLTENWIFHQVRFIRTARSIFLAKWTANLDQFPWDPVYALPGRGTLGRQWNGAVRNLLGFYPYFREVCRREGVNLIHTHSGSVGRRMLPLAQTLKVPLLTSFYGWEMFVHPQGVAGLRREYRRLFAFGAGFIAEGPAAAEQLVRIGCPAAKLELHRLGVDPAEIPFTERGPGQDGSFRVLMAARFDEKKGLPYGVEAVCRVARENGRIRLTVVGDASSQPKEQKIREKLHELVERFGMSERVQFTGFLSNPELHALAPAHHLFLHPSVRAENGDSEGGHPVVLTEMAATGLP